MMRFGLAMQKCRPYSAVAGHSCGGCDFGEFMNRFLAFAATSALMLGVLATAQPAYADQTLNTSVNLDDCSTSSATVTLDPGETLTINSTVTGTTPTGDSCFFVIVSERAIQILPDDRLSGWSFNGRDLSGFDIFPGPDPDDWLEIRTSEIFTLIAGSVSARIAIGRQIGSNDPRLRGSILMQVRASGSPVLPLVEYTLGFDANGGTCNLTNSGPIINGTWIKVPTAEQCTRPGYTLLGWNPRADGGDPLGFDPGGWTVMTGDNTLYAIWVPVS
jgi:hypothetical protein